MDRYTIVKELNHGSYGCVSLGRAGASGALVAVKMMAKAGGGAGMCKNEVALHARVSHPNIVRFIDSYECDGKVFLVLEYCPRGDVYEAITTGHGPSSHENVRDCMVQLIDAVLYLHSEGIAHRDIKPENIFISADGQFKLGDLGLATCDEWTREVGVGSDRYMAPEQFDESGALHSSHKADYWSLGITLLNILFARNPFKAATPHDPLWKDYCRDRETLYDVFPTLSQDTFEALQHVLVPCPDNRDLLAFREAILNAVEWTTDGIVEDDFAAAEAPAGPTENRAPLRTPSFHPPATPARGAATQADAGTQADADADADTQADADADADAEAPTSFPWKTALSNHAPPPKRSPSLRPLETIYDDIVCGSYDSGIGSSLRIPPSLQDKDRPASGSSLPTAPTHARAHAHAHTTHAHMHTTHAHTHTYSAGHGHGHRKRDKSHLQFAKSWSDWVEEDEEEEKEREGEGEGETSSSTGSTVDVENGIAAGDEDWLPQWEEE